MAEQHIQDLFETNARKGDGAFAVAFALLEIARKIDVMTSSVDRLGMGTVNSPGAGELIAKSLKEGLDRVADELEALPAVGGS